MADIGIVVVTFNSQGHIGKCLDAALRTGADLVVVDNASTDGTREEVTKRGVRLVSNAVNRGFAAAVNQGFTALDSPFVLLLNPDAEVLEGLELLKAACSLPGSGGAGGCLLGEDGKPQIGFMVRKLPEAVDLVFEVLLVNKAWPNNPRNRRYRGLELHYNVRIPVEQPAGAFLMAPRAVWQELGGFDEGFSPLWFEDVDFCRRALDRGHQLYYVPEAVAQHTGGHSIWRLSVEKRRVYWYRSLLRYSAKHFRPMAFRVVCLAVIVGSVLRALGESARRVSLLPLAVYGKVVRHAGRCLISGWGEDAVSSGPESV